MCDKKSLNNDQEQSLNHEEMEVKITGLDEQNFKRKLVNIFLPINFNTCFGCSKEPSHRDNIHIG